MSESPTPAAPESVPASVPDLVAVREGEQLDERAVERYLRANLPDLDGPMELLQFSGGHANLTYQVRFGEREFVLRRPPLGPVAPRSHDMAREYKVLSGLRGRFAAAPRAYLLCEDPSVLGATFIVMERCRGSVPRGELPADFRGVPDAPRRMAQTLIDTLADLHAVDYRAAGLADLGRPEGFTVRQVHGWKKRWDAAKHTELPEFDRHYEWLVKHLPDDGNAAVLHNDYKFDNTMFETGNPDRIAAVLDWDMATLGDPLMDLGTLLAYWREPGEDDARGGSYGALTALPGFPKRRELAERYAERRGIDVASVDWYEAFGIWKVAVIIQQIYIRYLRGQTRDERFADFAERVQRLVGAAREVSVRVG